MTGVQTCALPISENLVGAIKAALEDSSSQAVVLRINSPGGSPVQSGILNDEIRRLKAKHDKRVYVVVDEICASGAYYIAVAADRIYVDKASLVGSIGVLMDGFGFTGLMTKLGIERRLLTAGENKGMLDPFSPQNDKQKGYAQAMIDQVRAIIDFAVGDTRPHLTLLLDVPLAVSEARRLSRQAKLLDVPKTVPAGPVPLSFQEPLRDRMEEADRAFFERVHEGYQAIARAEPGRVRVIDATRSVEEVGAQVWAAVAPLL